MKRISKKVSIISASLATVGIAGASLFGASAFAATNTTGTSLADRIATKFNLKSSDVESVIKEDRQAHQKERLDRLVTDGKITQAQEDLIVAKMAEIEPKMEAARQLTDKTARKTAMDAIHTDLQTWAKANNIDERYIGPGGHGGRGRMMGGHMGQPPLDGANTQI